MYKNNIMGKADCAKTHFQILKSEVLLFLKMCFWIRNKHSNSHNELWNLKEHLRETPVIKLRTSDYYKFQKIIYKEK